MPELCDFVLYLRRFIYEIAFVLKIQLFREFERQQRRPAERTFVFNLQLHRFDRLLIGDLL